MANKRQTKKERIRNLQHALIPLVEAAYDRISQLTTDSSALKEAFRTMPKSRKKEQVFRSDLKREKDLQREYARVSSFLTDWASTKEGSDYFYSEKEALLKYGKVRDAEGNLISDVAFGGQWLAKTGETYDTDRIDKELAEKAFELYDKLVEEYQSEDRAKMLWNKDSRVTYGSETMIIALYDMVEQGRSESEIMSIARRRMELNYIEMQTQNGRFVSNVDYGVLTDDDYLTKYREDRSNGRLPKMGRI